MSTEHTVPTTEDLLRGLNFLHKDIGNNKYGVVELCVIAPNGGNGGGAWEGFATGKGIVSGWFDSASKLVSCVADIENGWVDRNIRKFAKGVYVTLNPCDPAILGRANNRLIAGQPRTSDKDIRHTSNLLIDIDAIRPAGVSASDAEKKLSEKVARRVADYLVNECMWPEPMICDSGNGYHLIFKLSLDITPGQAAAKIKAVLAALNSKFSSVGVDDDGHEIKVVIDSSVFNPSRLVKLWGTWTRKGDATKDRPHRMSGVMRVPEDRLAGPLTEHGLDVVLAAVEASNTNQENVTQGGQPAAGTKGSALFQPSSSKLPEGTRLDVDAYLEHYGIEVVGKKDCAGTDGGKYTLWTLQSCLFDPSHDGNEAAIGQFDDGKLFYQCFHQSCKSDPDRRWKDVRLIISGEDHIRRFLVDMAGKPVSEAQFEDLTRLKFPRVNDKGKPAKLYANFSALADHYGVSVRYNLMARKADVSLQGGMWKDSDRILTLSRAYLIDLCTQHGLVSTGLIDDWLNLRSSENEYHPAIEWIETQEWDGVPRFEALAATVETETPDAWRTYLRKWLIQAVAALYEPRFSCRGVLSFVGGQGIGKTSWLKSLTPVEIGAFGEGLSIDPGNKDSLVTAISKWIVELGEVDATFRQADISRLKAFLTKGEDEVRLPYGRVYEHFTRRTVFASTVNKTDFLVDQTGNTRWWVIEAKSINWRHGIDMQQLWAEARTWYQAGETWFLDDKETDMLHHLNSKFEQEDPITDSLRSLFFFDSPCETWTEKYRAMDIAKAMGVDAKDIKNTRLIGSALKRLGCKQENIVVNGIKGRYYSLPTPRGTNFFVNAGVDNGNWLGDNDKNPVKQ